MRQWHPKRWEFERASADVNYSKNFNPALEAIINDELEPASSRLWAAIVRTSWGNHCLYCVGEDDQPLIQGDFARWLKIPKQRVSKVIQYYEKRGRLERPGIGKLIQPCISPTLSGPSPDADEKSPEWATFLQTWKVAHSYDWAELEVARSTVARIRKVMRADYKRSRAPGTNEGALEVLEGENCEKGDTSSSASSEPPKATTTTTPTAPQLAAVAELVEGLDQFVPPVGMDEEMARAFIRRARERVLDITVPEILHFAGQRWPCRGNPDFPRAVLVAATVRLISFTAVAALRMRTREAHEADLRAEERHRQILKDLEEDDTS